MLVLKPQPTLRGYNAWVLMRLVKARDSTPAEITAWIVEKWIDKEDVYLKDRYGIDPDEFRTALEHYEDVRKLVQSPKDE